jgi:hypothetical protein
MVATTQSRAVFRGTRQLVINLVVAVAGLVLFVVLGISVVVAPPSTGVSSEWGGLGVCIVGVLALSALIVRLRTAFTVDLGPETLTYRTLLRTVRIQRSDVAGIGLKDRNKGTARLSQPYLDMRDGRTIWLADLGQGKVIHPASTMQGDLLSAVTDWLEQTTGD